MKKNKFRNHEFRIIVKEGIWNSSLFIAQYRKKLNFLSFSWYTAWIDIDHSSINMSLSGAKEDIRRFVGPKDVKVLGYIPVEINSPIQNNETSI